MYPSSPAGGSLIPGGRAGGEGVGEEEELNVLETDMKLANETTQWISAEFEYHVFQWLKQLENATWCSCNILHVSMEQLGTRCWGLKIA